MAPWNLQCQRVKDFVLKEISISESYLECPVRRIIHQTFYQLRLSLSTGLFGKQAGIKTSLMRGRPREQRDVCVSWPWLLTSSWEGSQRPAKPLRAADIWSEGGWGCSQARGGSGRKFSSFLFSFFLKTSRVWAGRGVGRSQKIQRKQLWFVQEKPLELLEVARRPGVGEVALCGRLLSWDMSA